MKKGVVIGASRDAIHTIQKARENGIYVVALDGNPEAEGFQYANEKIVVDISDQDKTYVEVEKIKPDFCIPIPIGRYLSTMGFINDKFGFKGAGYAATEVSTDKFLFHRVLNKAGLRNVQMYLVNDQTNLADVKIKYPAILKPRFGSGSRDVFFVSSDKELAESLQKIKEFHEDFILEQAVEGTEYSIDGAVIDGKLQMTLLRKKIITPLPVRQPVSSFSVIKSEDNSEIIERVQNYMQKVVDVLHYDACLINADLIINEKEVFAIEAAPRPSGHNLHNVFVPLATGIDIAEQYIKYLMSKQYCFVTDNVKPIQIRFFDFNNVVVEYVPTEYEIRKKLGDNLIRWECNIKTGEHLGKVVNGHSIMGRGFFIVNGKDEADLISKSEWVLAQFKARQEG